MPGLEENVLENLSAREIVLGVISLKQDKAPIHFSEEALEFGLGRAVADFPHLRTLFEPTSDGTPEHTTPFGNVMMLLGYAGGPIMHLTSDLQWMCMPSYGKSMVQKMLWERGPAAVEELRHVSRKVWEYAREYR